MSVGHYSFIVYKNIKLSKFTNNYELSTGISTTMNFYSPNRRTVFLQEKSLIYKARDCISSTSFSIYS